MYVPVFCLWSWSSLNVSELALSKMINSYVEIIVFIISIYDPLNKITRKKYSDICCALLIPENFLYGPIMFRIFSTNYNDFKSLRCGL